MFDKSVITRTCTVSRDETQSDKVNLCAIPKGTKLNVKPLGVDAAMAWVGKRYIGIVSMSRLA